VSTLSTQSLLALAAVAAIGLAALGLSAWLVRVALRGRTPDRRAAAAVCAMTSVAVVVVVIGLFIAVTSDTPNPGVLATVSRLHPQFRALLDPAAPPARFPPIEHTSGAGMTPGTVLFTTYTTPRRTDDMAFYPSFIAEVDKASGNIAKAQRMYAGATMFQPEPGGRYSYNVIDRDGVEGAGFEVTHHVTDDDLEVLASYDLDDLEGGDADLHDFQLLDNGNALLLAYRRREVDLRAFGGPVDGLVWDTVIAERTPDGETVWLWDGAEHMDLADVPAAVAEAQLTRSPPAVGDYAHPNSLDLFADGDVLVSIRHYDCLYRIDRPSGEIVWTFGGPNCAGNDFAISGDPYDGPSHQHDATLLDGRTILLFDNGNLRSDPVSRVAEYAIDERTMTAELVWSYDDGRFTPIMGSAERLANDNTLIGWGQLHAPAITEVTPDGDRVFTLSMPPGQLVYRAYQGTPRP
jgi:hypothetical protein